MSRRSDHKKLVQWEKLVKESHRENDFFDTRPPRYRQLVKTYVEEMKHEFKDYN